jgi:AcrR family transcriptional regulator
VTGATDTLEARAPTPARVRSATGRVSNADRNLKSRTAILAAAQQIMREDGYAAVSSRRIAVRAALKSQLVHYYFKTMDELFLALFRDVEAQFFARLDRATASSRPLRAVWNVCKDIHGPRLTKEFVAMATHHESLRAEIARSAERTRGVFVAQLTHALAANGISQDAWPPLALAVLMDGAGRLLIADHTLGATAGHDEVIAFIETQIARLEPGATDDHR